MTSYGTKLLSSMQSFSAWSGVISTEFSDPAYLKMSKDGYIHMAVILKNITAGNVSGFKLRVNLSKWLKSVITNTNRYVFMFRVIINVYVIRRVINVKK